MSLQAAMLSCASILSENEVLVARLPSQERIHQTISDLIDNICASVPYLLGDVDENGAPPISSEVKTIGPLFCMYFLKVSGSTAGMPLALQEWIQDQLLHIGHSVGIRQALNIRAKVVRHPKSAEDLQKSYAILRQL
jgi:hypothetical protein